MPGERENQESLLSLITTLRGALFFHPEKIDVLLGGVVDRVTGLIAKNTDELFAALSEKTTSGENAFYFLMAVLENSVVRSSKKIPDITKLIDTVLTKLSTDQLATALSEKATAGNHAGKNALWLLMSALNKIITKTKIDLSLLTIFFNLLAKLDAAAMIPASKQLIFDHKKKLKSYLEPYLNSHKENSALADMCHPKTMLGVFIDHQTGSVFTSTITATRRMVNKLISKKSQQSEWDEISPQEINALSTSVPPPQIVDVAKQVRELIDSSIQEINEMITEGKTFDTLVEAFKNMIETAKKNGFDVNNNEAIRALADAIYKKEPSHSQKETDTAKHVTPTFFKPAQALPQTPCTLTKEADKFIELAEKQYFLSLIFMSDEEGKQYQQNPLAFWKQELTKTELKNLVDTVRKELKQQEAHDLQSALDKLTIPTSSPDKPGEEREAYRQK